MTMKKGESCSQIPQGAPTAPNRLGKVAQMRRDFLKTSCAACGGLAMGLRSPGLGGRGTAHAPGSGLVYRNYQPDKMTYARLGKTDFAVSSLSLGGYANSFPENNDGRTADSDPAAYQAALQRCLDRGVNYFDTARKYYDTEGHFTYLCHPDRRNKLFLSSKVSTMHDPRSDLNETLKAMNHADGWLDIYYVHHLQYRSGSSLSYGGVGENFQELLVCLDKIDELVAEGRVRYKGFTTHNWELARDLITKHGDRIDVMLVPYCPTKNGPSDKAPPTTWDSQVIQLAHSLDIGVVSMKTFLGPNTPMNQRWAKLQSDADAWPRVQPYLGQDRSLPQACLKWSMENEKVKTRLVGMRRVNEVDEDAYVFQEAAAKSRTGVDAKISSSAARAPRL